MSLACNSVFRGGILTILSSSDWVHWLGTFLCQPQAWCWGMHGRKRQVWLYCQREREGSRPVVVLILTWFSRSRSMQAVTKMTSFLGEDPHFFDPSGQQSLFHFPPPNLSAGDGGRVLKGADGTCSEHVQKRRVFRASSASPKVLPQNGRVVHQDSEGLIDGSSRNGAGNGCEGSLEIFGNVRYSIKPTTVRNAAGRGFIHLCSDDFNGHREDPELDYGNVMRRKSRNRDRETKSCFIDVQGNKLHCLSRDGKVANQEAFARLDSNVACQAEGVVGNSRSQVEVHVASALCSLSEGEPTGSGVASPAQVKPFGPSEPGFVSSQSDSPKTGKISSTDLHTPGSVAGSRTEVTEQVQDTTHKLMFPAQPALVSPTRNLESPGSITAGIPEEVTCEDDLVDSMLRDPEVIGEGDPGKASEGLADTVHGCHVVLDSVTAPLTQHSSPDTTNQGHQTRTTEHSEAARSPVLNVSLQSEDTEKEGLGRHDAEVSCDAGNSFRQCDPVNMPPVVAPRDECLVMPVMTPAEAPNSPGSEGEGGPVVGNKACEKQLSDITSKPNQLGASRTQQDLANAGGGTEENIPYLGVTRSGKEHVPDLGEEHRREEQHGPNEWGEQHGPNKRVPNVEQNRKQHVDEDVVIIEDDDDDEDEDDADGDDDMSFTAEGSSKQDDAPSDSDGHASDSDATSTRRKSEMPRDFVRRRAVGVDPHLMASASFLSLDDSDDDCQVIAEIPIPSSRRKGVFASRVANPPHTAVNGCGGNGDPDFVMGSCQSELRRQWEEAALRKRMSRAMKSEASNVERRTASDLKHTRPGPADDCRPGAASPLADDGEREHHSSRHGRAESVATSTDTEPFTSGGIRPESSVAGERLPGGEEPKSTAERRRGSSLGDTGSFAEVEGNSVSDSRRVSTHAPIVVDSDSTVAVDVPAHQKLNEGAPQLMSEALQNHLGVEGFKAQTSEPKNDVQPLAADGMVGDREKIKETQEFKQADDQEWARRKIELQRQASEVQRLRKRKRAEADRRLEMESRQKQRLEEIRQLQQQEELNLGLKDELRGKIRARLEGLAKSCTDMASLLRRLGIAVEGGASCTAQQVNSAYKRALLKFHPDRVSTPLNGDPRTQVEAEETFKVMSRLKNSLPPVASPTRPAGPSRFFNH